MQYVLHCAWKTPVCLNCVIDNLPLVQALPVVFKCQGQVILSKAEAMGESVGTAHLGFMAEVQEEMQVRGLCALVTFESFCLAYSSM